MSLFNEADLRKRAQTRSSRFSETTIDSLNKSISAAAARSEFDVFLSHSYLDKELILGITDFLEKELGYSVYVDWKQDSQLSRENVTKETAEQLRIRILQSKSLFFATTEAAKESRWMPWELGYMDGKKAKAAILPIAQRTELGETYKGREYLGLYPYVVPGRNTDGKSMLWIHEDAKVYVSFERWLEGIQPRQH